MEYYSSPSFSLCELIFFFKKNLSSTKHILNFSLITQFFPLILSRSIKQIPSRTIPSYDVKCGKTERESNCEQNLRTSVSCLQNLVFSEPYCESVI